MISEKNDKEVSVTGYGLRGGVKVKVGGNGLLNLGLQYLIGSGEYDDGTDKTDFEVNELSLRAGFSLYL